MTLPASVPKSQDKLEALARVSTELGAAADLDTRISRTLSSLSQYFGYDHSMLWVPADDSRHLIMLACHGYPGGVGATVALGQGVIGVCAERRLAMRINNLERALSVVQASQERPSFEVQIPFPGIVNAQSQLAVPVVIEDKLTAVLYVEDAQKGYYFADDSHALQIVANLLGAAIRVAADESEPAQVKGDVAPSDIGQSLKVRYYDSDGSVFFDDEYVIKSLPGRILFKLLKVHGETGRQEFTKRELRLDATLQLPQVRDNLDTRLILLRRRLAERFPFVQLVSVGRGRFSLVIDRPFELAVVSSSYP